MLIEASLHLFFIVDKVGWQHKKLVKTYFNQYKPNNLNFMKGFTTILSYWFINLTMYSIVDYFFLKIIFNLQYLYLYVLGAICQLIQDMDECIYILLFNQLLTSSPLGSLFNFIYSSPHLSINS
jgi:hypothetical protein